jgi:hypothetical protein
MLARIWALTIKEFLALLKDKRSRLVLIVPPLMQLMVFGYAATFDLNEVPYVIYNQDSGQASRNLLAYFQGSHNFQLLDRLESETQIAPLVESGDALMALVIHPHFSKDLLSGRSGRMQVIIDGRNSNTALILLGYVQSIVTQFSGEWLRTHGGETAPTQLEVRAWFNPNLESRWFIVPGIAGLLTLLVSLLVTSLSVAGSANPAPLTSFWSPLKAGGDTHGQGPARLDHRIRRSQRNHHRGRAVVQGSASGQPLGALSGPVFVFAIVPGSGAHDFIVLRHSAAKPVGHLSLHGAGGDPLRLCHTHSQHAPHRADHDPGQSLALFLGGAAPGIFGRRGRGTATGSILANGRHRPGVPHRGKPALPFPHAIEKAHL